MKIIAAVTTCRVSALLIAAGFITAFGGCSKPNTTASVIPTPTPLERALATWVRGDKTAAVRLFAETDWDLGPAFSSGSPITCRESEILQMSPTAETNFTRQVSTRLAHLYALVRAVRDEGMALAGSNPDLAYRYFDRIDECAEALDQPERMRVVQFLGQTFHRMAEAESKAVARTARTSASYHSEG